jgi:hypothetical protein
MRLFLKEKEKDTSERINFRIEIEEQLSHVME